MCTDIHAGELFLDPFLRGSLRFFKQVYISSQYEVLTICLRVLVLLSETLQVRSFASSSYRSSPPMFIFLVTTERAVRFWVITLFFVFVFQLPNFFLAFFFFSHFYFFLGALNVSPVSSLSAVAG